MKQVKLRVPDDLHARIKEAAEHEHRSLHGEAIALLELGLDSPDRPANFDARVRRINEAHDAAHAEHRANRVTGDA